MEWTVTTTAPPNVHEIVFDGDYREPGWERWVLLTGDRHWDNPKSDWTLQKKHLDEAKAKGAPVIDVGDWFCLMQGRWDKRSAKSDIRPEHNVNDYLDAIPQTAVDFFAPYADNIAVIGYGNHEKSIKKHQETDVLARFVYRLNNECGSNVQLGGYGGYVKIKFAHKNFAVSKWLKYYHGSGGGGPVTKGVIQTNRRAVYTPDADIIVTGHIHEKWTINIPRERITRQGRIHIDNQLHVSVSTYKREYAKGAGGWHVERGAPPKPIGGYWLRFTFDRVRQDGRDAQVLNVQAIDCV